MEDLENYLKLVTLPERAELFLKACKLLVDVGMTSVLDEIPNLLAMAEAQDTETTLKGMDSFFTDCLIRKLSEFGVTVHQCHLAEASAIVETLQLLDGFDMAETISIICEGDSTAEEKLADLAEIVGLIDWGVLMTTVETVSPKLIERIYELAGKAAEEKAEAAQVNVNLDNVKFRLLQFVEAHPNSLIEGALVSRFPLGTDLELSVKTFEAGLLTLAPIPAANAVVGIVLASNTPDASVERAVSDVLEKVYHDVEFTMAASSAALELLKDIKYVET